MSVSLEMLDSIVMIGLESVVLVPVSFKVVFNGELNTEDIGSHYSEWADFNELDEETVDNDMPYFDTLKWDSILYPDVKKLVVKHYTRKDNVCEMETLEGVSVRNVVESVFRVKEPGSSVFSHILSADREDDCLTLTISFDRD